MIAPHWANWLFHPSPFYTHEVIHDYANHSFEHLLVWNLECT